MPKGCKQKPPEERASECLCFLNAQDPDRVHLEAFTGEKDDLKGAAFWVTRLAFDPPPGTDLIEFIREKLPHYEEIPNEPNAKVGDIPAVRFYSPRSPQAPSYEEIYFIKDNKFFLINMLDVDEKANRELYDRISSALEISVETSTGGQFLVACYGHVISLPDKYPFDDYLSSDGAGGYLGCGLTGADAEIEAAIEALRDKGEPGKYAHFWGTITYGVDDYGTCQFVVTRLRPDAPGLFFDPDRVEDWEGIIVSTQPMAQFDDYFVLAGDYPLGYGIDSSDPTPAAQLESLRDTGTTVRLWGQLSAGIPDVNGTRIQVSRIEVVERPPAPLPPEGWASYVNTDYGFAFHYPPTWALEEVPAWEDERGKWAPSVKLSQETLTLVIGYKRTTEDIFIEGGGAAGDVVPRGSVAFLGQELRRRVLVFEGKDKAVYYYTAWIQAGDLVFGISLHDFATDYQAIGIPERLQVEVDQIVESFELTPKPTGKPVDGWVGTIVRLPPGSQFGDYFERQDGQRFGIGSADETSQEQMEDACWTGAQVKVWGQLLTGIPAYEGRQVQLEREIRGLSALSGY